jgi:SpoVK/Ycf46/Vps4 family AAA+-type ATPase
LGTLREAYNLRRKSLLLLTGAVHDLFPLPARGEGGGRWGGLEEVLVHELGDKFHLARLDLATGLTFYDQASEQALLRRGGPGAGELLETSKHRPLAGLTLLRGLQKGNVASGEEGQRPMLIVMPYAGALFPAGDLARLSELDRQRLVFFLQWLNDPAFIHGADLVLFVHPLKSEVNAQLMSLPATGHLEIPLPELSDRQAFVRWFCHLHPGLRFNGGRKQFCHAAAGLTLASIRELLEVAVRSGQRPGREDVVEEVNRLLEAELGDIVRVRDPHHLPEDIVGYHQTGEIFRNAFERCEDPETAVPALLVSGPNGGGKTFQLEAWAAASGRSVVELSGIRGSLFGETDRFFERLRWHLSTFGKILVLVDEAHTAFGSVHSAGTHGTEKRLAGNLIKLMSDPTFLGKVLWGLMTSRPDALDPDIKSRAPIQIPIFDLEGEERRAFVAELFHRKGIDLGKEELTEVMATTDYYSARDYKYLVSEALAVRRRKPQARLAEVLEGWQASRAIVGEREQQTLIAAQHCSDRRLLPARLREPGPTRL